MLDPIATPCPKCGAAAQERCRRIRAKHTSTPPSYRAKFCDDRKQATVRRYENVKLNQKATDRNRFTSITEAQ